MSGIANGLFGTTDNGQSNRAYEGLMNFDNPELRDVFARLGLNTTDYINSVSNPQEQMLKQGFGDLTRSLNQRGIAGSSFGNTEIGNYQSAMANSLANTRAGALQGSLALQGQIGGNLGAQRLNALTGAGGIANQIAGINQKDRLGNLNMFGKLLGGFGASSLFGGGLPFGVSGNAAGDGFIGP